MHGETVAPTAIGLPRRTREILEAKLREQATLQALLQQQGQAINELIEAAREMLDVPAGWELANTGVGFVAPEGGGPSAE